MVQVYRVAISDYLRWLVAWENGEVFDIFRYCIILLFDTHNYKSFETCLHVFQIVAVYILFFNTEG